MKKKVYKTPIVRWAYDIPCADSLLAGSITETDGRNRVNVRFDGDYDNVEF